MLLQRKMAIYTRIGKSAVSRCVGIFNTIICRENLAESPFGFHTLMMIFSAEIRVLHMPRIKAANRRYLLSPVFPVLFVQYALHRSEICTDRLCFIVTRSFIVKAEQIENECFLSYRIVHIRNKSISHVSVIPFIICPACTVKSKEKDAVRGFGHIFIQGPNICVTLAASRCILVGFPNFPVGIKLSAQIKFYIRSGFVYHNIQSFAVVT